MAADVTSTWVDICTMSSIALYVYMCSPVGVVTVEVGTYRVNKCFTPFLVLNT